MGRHHGSGSRDNPAGSDTNDSGSKNREAAGGKYAGTPGGKHPSSKLFTGPQTRKGKARGA